MQLKKCGRKGCEIFVVRIENLRKPKDAMHGDEEVRGKLKESFEEKYYYLKKSQDVFPEELPRLHPSQVFYFTIYLVPRAEQISLAPYQMTTTY